MVSFFWGKEVGWEWTSALWIIAFEPTKKTYWRSLTNQCGSVCRLRTMIFVRSTCISSYLLVAMFYHTAFHILSCFYLTLAIRRSRRFPFWGGFVWDVPTSRPLTPIARNQTSLAQVASCCHPGRCSCLGISGWTSPNDVTGSKHEGIIKGQGTNGAYRIRVQETDVSTRKKPGCFFKFVFFVVACVQSTWTIKACILQPVTATIKLQPVLVRFHTVQWHDFS